MKALDNPSIFWNTCHIFLDVHLKSIRQLSEKTIETYRSSLNIFIDYIETSLSIKRIDMTFQIMSKDNLKRFQAWMLTDKKLAAKTSNLRLTAIRSLLEYASQEHIELMYLYANACSIKGTQTANHPIEYFEKDQLTALLKMPENASRIDKRNNMILIFLYDTAMRVCEARNVKIKDIHFNASNPYVHVIGKGRKHRNIPLMDRTIEHLKKYIQTYHGEKPDPDAPLFYSKIKGNIGELSDDTFEKIIKKHSEKACEANVEMPNDVHCHMLRKTRAMDLYRSKVPLTHIQQLLGHENISTTSGFYAFATLDMLAESLNKVCPDNNTRVWDDPEVMKEILRL